MHTNYEKISVSVLVCASEHHCQSPSPSLIIDFQISRSIIISTMSSCTSVCHSQKPLLSLPSHQLIFWFLAALIISIWWTTMYRRRQSSTSFLTSRKSPENHVSAQGRWITSIFIFLLTYFDFIFCQKLLLAEYYHYYYMFRILGLCLAVI